MTMFPSYSADASQLPEKSQTICIAPFRSHDRKPSCLEQHKSIRNPALTTTMAGHSKFLQDLSYFNSHHCNYYNDEEGQTNDDNISTTLSDDLDEEQEEARNAEIFEPIPLELAKEQDQHQGSLFSQVNPTDAKTMINILSSGDISSNPNIAHSSYVRSNRFKIDNMPKNQFPYSSYPTTLTHFRQLVSTTNGRIYNSTTAIPSQAGNINHCTMKRNEHASPSTTVRHIMPAAIPSTLCYNELEQGAPKRLMTNFQNNYRRMNTTPVVTGQLNKMDQSKQILPSGRPQLKMKMRMIERHGQKTQIVMEPVYE